MRDFVLGLSVSAAFIVGCLVGGASPSTTVPEVGAEPAAVGGQRVQYEYKCTAEKVFSAEEYAARLNKEGAEGWRVEGSFEGPLGATMCFWRER